MQVSAFYVQDVELLLSDREVCLNLVLPLVLKSKE